MKLVFFILSLYLFGWVNAQELNAQIAVTADNTSFQPTNVQADILKEMEQSVFEFLNNSVWTNDQFELEERIDCSFNIVIQEINGNQYSGYLQVKSTRPIYNSSYNSVTMNYIDKEFNVIYERNAIFLYSEDQFRNNFTSILAYYAFMILGFDYDSFSEMGGTKYFEKAQKIANNASQSGYSGWSNSGSNQRNRFWFVDNALHQIYKPIREFYYGYHRLGFDKLASDPTGSLKLITTYVKKLESVHRVKPGSLNLQILLSAKKDELINLYSQADQGTKNQVIAIFKKLDPANADDWDEINKRR